MADPQRFTLVQHFALTVNRYDLRELGADSIEGSKMAWAQETRMPFSAW